MTNVDIASPGELLRLYGRPAKKSFGQNFLTDPSILDRICDAAGVRAGTPVLEIGPGVGGLTSRLIARGAVVRALEPDRDLVAHLQDALPASLLDLVEGDALTEVLYDAVGQPPRTVVANLPYNVATEILMRLVDGPAPPDRMALMFQREVAERIVAKGATRHFGPLAIGVQLTYEVELAIRLGPGAFTPRPKVDSAVVAFRRRQEDVLPVALRDEIRRVARAAFGQRRKMLRRSLKQLDPSPEGWLARAEVSPTARPEALTLDDFTRLAQTRKGQ